MELSLRDTQLKNPFVGLIIGVSMTVICIKPNVLREKCLMLYSLPYILFPLILKPFLVSRDSHSFLQSLMSSVSLPDFISHQGSEERVTATWTGGII